MICKIPNCVKKLYRLNIPQIASPTYLSDGSVTYKSMKSSINQFYLHQVSFEQVAINLNARGLCADANP